MTDQELIVHLSRKVATLEIEVKQNWDWYKKANSQKESLEKELYTLKISYDLAKQEPSIQ